MRISKRWMLHRVSILAAFFAAAVVSAQDGGVEIFSGMTIFESGSRTSLSHLYSRRGSLFSGSDEVPNSEDSSMEEHRAVFGFTHGVTPALSLSLLLPVLRKESSNLPDPGVTQRSEGLGDAALLGKYRFFSEYWEQSVFHVAAFGGLEFPTGSSGERDGAEFLPFSMQLGSGSVDAIGGVVLTLSIARFRFDALALYKANNEGSRGFSEGDFFVLGTSFAYRFYHAKYPGPSASAKVGLSWRQEDPDELAGAAVANTGMSELRLIAGLTYHPYPEIDLVASVEVPVYGDYDGEQLALDVRTFFGFGIRF